MRPMERAVDFGDTKPCRISLERRALGRTCPRIDAGYSNPQCRFLPTSPLETQMLAEWMRTSKRGANQAEHVPASLPSQVCEAVGVVPRCSAHASSLSIVIVAMIITFGALSSARRLKSESRTSASK